MLASPTCMANSLSKLESLDTVAQSVERLSKVPVWCNSTEVGLNHAAA